MNEAALKALWGQEYSREAGRQALALFGDVWTPRTLETPRVEAGMGTVTELGTVGAGGFPVEVVEIILEDRYRLASNRVTLNHRLKAFFNAGSSSGVLAFFTQPGQKRWRLTFAARQTQAGSLDLAATDAHRFTFVLGPDTGVRTAARAWLTLTAGAPTATAWKHAFSQEAVTGKFFERYRQFYDLFVAAMTTTERRRMLGVVDNDKPLRDWVKKLLGRLVFLKFLEKKGWLGAQDYAAHDGDRRFLRRLFDLHPGNFYPEALVPLFFETLNTPRAGDSLGISPGGKVPYLNGGLFDNDYDIETVEKCLTFDGQLFQDLLEFFDEYHFTVDEHGADEAEIGVDPEMLGRIFEQLIEDNEKDKNGTIYTPYPVVEFMVQTSLHLFLCRTLGTDRDTPLGESLRRFVVFQDVAGIPPGQVTTLDGALADLRVLDPAVGSGAFPLGVLKEVVRMRLALALTVGADDTPELRSKLKRHAIGHTLYGVDLDRGAVDIARLRLFLALVVDSPEPEPLPNLDFKIIQGDSLAEAWEEIPLVFPIEAYRKANAPDEGDLFGAADHAQAKSAGGRNALEVALADDQDVLALLADYVKPAQDPAAKKATKAALEAFEHRFVAAVIDEEILARQKPLDDAKVRGNPKKLAKAQESLARALAYRADYEGLLARKNPEKPYILWHLYFHDAFEAGGWDIIIGNPPYRANQENENDQAKNREYPLVDARVKETFVAKSTAQKTKVYDLFARFFRLMFDFALASEKKPVVSFITNYAFIGKRTFDGFRRDVAETFARGWVLDLGGDVRADPRLSGPVNSIFGIQAGVAVSLWEPPLTPGPHAFELRYQATNPVATRAEKIAHIHSLKAEGWNPPTITPDAKATWVNQTDSDWEDLVALDGNGEERVFHMTCNGIKTNRDDWVYDFSKTTAADKARLLVDRYEAQRSSGRVGDQDLDYMIKWSSTLKNNLAANQKAQFDNQHLARSIWRPFCTKWFYKDKVFNDRLTSSHLEIWGQDLCTSNTVFSVPGVPCNDAYYLLSFSGLMDYHGTGDGTFCALKRIDSRGMEFSNLTPWALSHFRTRYAGMTITPERVFHYVYAVLHNPAYRLKYTQELKQDLPRIPLYPDFDLWADWGAELMTLHADFEAQAEYPGIATWPGEGSTGRKNHEAVYVKDNRGHRAYTGTVVFNDGSGLAGIPPRAFDYKLGNKSGIEWILDQYVESHWPTDAEVAQGRKLREDERVLRDRFNTFRFADYKDQVISLIKKVTTISLRTLELQEAMAQLEGHEVDLRAGYQMAAEEAPDSEAAEGGIHE